MDGAEKIGIVLANTGTPGAPRPRAVRAYLARFLGDRRIAPMNRFAWWFILHLFILPRRGVASAEKYEKIWTPDGSPFTIAHEKLANGLQAELSRAGYRVSVKAGMSYSDPFVRNAVKELKEEGCDRLIVLPLYPQSAYSTTGAVADGVKRACARTRGSVPVDFIDNYHDNAMYHKAIAASLRHAGFDEASGDKVLFSYHSIPLTDIEDGDTYELQAGASSLAIAGELGLNRTSWTIGYQCRFDKGREWLSPYTTDVLTRWAEAKVGKIFFVCPGFAVDCLETLYDIPYELKPFYFEKLREAGAVPFDDRFVYVPCLDRSRAHLKVLVDVLRPHLEGK